MMANEKPYYDLNRRMREQFGGKIYKLALSGGMTCPNRDGKISYGGCIFCSEGGSGDFAAAFSLSISEQIKEAKQKIKKKLGNEYENCRYIAYFQSYTNTYAPVEYLRKIFTEAISEQDVCALSIGTRPDCIDDKVLELLAELNRIKPVWIELGLQTIHEDTAEYINRGYKLPVYDECVKRLRAAGIEVIVHLILGLPFETAQDMLESAKYVGASGATGIKLQLLHVISGTELGKRFLENEAFRECLNIRTSEEYITLLADILEILPPDIVIHRLTGDAPHDKLLFPKWSANKRTTLNGILKEMRQRGSYQGKK